MNFPHRDDVKAYQDYLADQQRDPKWLRLDLTIVSIILFLLCAVDAITPGQAGQGCVLLVMLYFAIRGARYLVRRIEDALDWED